MSNQNIITRELIYLIFKKFFKNTTQMSLPRLTAYELESFCLKTQQNVERSCWPIAIRTSQQADSLHADYRNENFEWRPFQFAFQLLNVEGLLGGTDHEHREILDLAWFPTGGGKTEAYLGLIAMIAFYRRLDPEKGPREMSTPGISAIMRYTLRLLTADQASRLIRLCGAMNIVWS